jgi:hypothetical protein
MHTEFHPFHSRRNILLVIIFALAAISLACTVQNSLFRYFLGHRDEDESFMNQFEMTVVPDDLVTGDNSESVLEGDQSFGSADGATTDDQAELPALPEPATQDCSESGICVAAYPVDIRGTANPPEVIAFANAAEYTSPAGISITYTENAGPWYEWLVLKEPGDWIQASSPAGYSALGIQYWGDQTNGWASLILDGVEVWRGDVTAYGTDGVNYFVYVELTGEISGPHTLRTEVLGQNGVGGGYNVPVFYFAYRK